MVGRDCENSGSWPTWAEKFTRPYLNGKKLGMEACACNPSNSGKYEIGELCSWLAWAKRDLISKIRTKSVGGIAQVVKHLSSKSEAPSSNPSTPLPTKRTQNKTRKNTTKESHSHVQVELSSQTVCQAQAPLFLL
jgi:hypothetical protein